MQIKKINKRVTKNVRGYDNSYHFIQCNTEHFGFIYVQFKCMSVVPI